MDQTIKSGPLKITFNGYEYRATFAGYENFVTAPTARGAFDRLIKELDHAPMRRRPRRMGKSYNIVNDRKRRDLPGFNENTRKHI